MKVASIVIAGALLATSTAAAAVAHRSDAGAPPPMMMMPKQRRSINKNMNQKKIHRTTNNINRNGPVRRHAFQPAPSSFSAGGATVANPPYSTADCKEYYFTQKLDHFTFNPAEQPQTFQQRYYVCKKEEWWKGNGSPIFFYTGNEANVELYVNMTGFMWENAQNYGAAIVFAEHRYFGKSMPFANDPMPSNDKLRFLSTEQAMNDYAAMIQWIRSGGDAGKNNNNNNNKDLDWTGALNSPVIGFGGSYGGMLCAWTRAKFPNALDGCVAGSAPVIDFVGMEPAVDFGGFAEIETFDASVAGGASSDSCKQNIHAVLTAMFDADTASPSEMIGNKIAAQVGVCNADSSLQTNGQLMLNAFTNAIGMMTMGSYPFPSSYMMMGGKGDLPPYPMRLACDKLNMNASEAFVAASSSSSFTPSPALYKAFGEAMQIFYAAAGPISCINVNQDVNEASQIVDYLWGYLSCTSVMMPQTMNGQLNNTTGGDMFYPSPFSVEGTVQGCISTYGVTPDQLWVQTSFGGRRLIETTTNTVFTNGELDPWRFGGFNEDDVNKKYFNAKNRVVLVKNAGHHMELMFANPNDSQTNVVEVRKMILGEMDRWIAERTRGTAADNNNEARLH